MNSGRSAARYGWQRGATETASHVSHPLPMTVLARHLIHDGLHNERVWHNGALINLGGQTVKRVLREIRLQSHNAVDNLRIDDSYVLAAMRQNEGRATSSLQHVK